jgi:hypothetical protein
MAGKGKNSDGKEADFKIRGVLPQSKKTPKG